MTPLEEKQAYLFTNETAYLRAVAYVKSEQYIIDRGVALDKIQGILNYAAHQENEALFLLGRVTQVFEDLCESANLIIRYESEKKSVAEYTARSKSR